MCSLYVAPLPPENIMASVINSTTVEVIWNPPNITNGILRSYTVVYGSSDEIEMMNVNIRQDCVTNVVNCSVGTKQNNTETTDYSSSSSRSEYYQLIVKTLDSPSNVTVLVSGLDPFTNYTFYVLAVTVAPSEPSDNVTVVTDEAGMYHA